MKDLEIISKTVKINNSDDIIFARISDMRNISRFIPPEIKDWHADENFCSFSAQGRQFSLQIVEKTPFNLVKITSDETSNEKLTIWIQLKQLSMSETAARIVVHVKANLIVRNLIKGKLQEGVNQIVEMLKYL